MKIVLYIGTVLLIIGLVQGSLLYHWDFDSGNLTDNVTGINMTAGAGIKLNEVGMFGESIYCNNSYLDSGYKYPIGGQTKNLTMLFWGKRVGTGNQNIFGRVAGGANMEYQWSTSNRYEIFTCDDAITECHTKPLGYNTSTEWVMHTIQVELPNSTYPNSRATHLFYNGRFYTSDGSYFEGHSAGTNNFLCNNYAGPGGGFIGWIDELWVFDHWLSQTERDNMFLYNSLEAPSAPPVTGQTIDITLNSPDDNFISNQNLTASYTPDSSLNYSMNCSIYINNSLDNTNLSVTDLGTYDINALFTEDGSYEWYINCTDSTVYNVSDTRTFTYDTINPIIYTVTPSDNNITKGTTSITLNFTCVNTNIDSFNITTYNDSALTTPIESAIHESIGGWLYNDDFTTFNFTQSGIKYFNAVCSDVAHETTVTTTYDFDIDNPTDSNLQNNASSPVIGDNVRFHVDLADNRELASYTFSWNNSGTYVNDSLVAISGTTQSVDVDKTVTLPKNNYVCGKFHYKDDLGLESVTAETCYTTGNNIPVFNPELEDQATIVGASFSYGVNCDDGDSDNITYTMNNSLLSINADTGLISYNPVTQGIEGVLVNCTDNSIIVQDEFVLTIGAPAPETRWGFLAVVPVLIVVGIFFIIYRQIFPKQ